MGHHHDHSPPAGDQMTWAFAISVGLNLTFTIVQAVYALYAHSMSLLADAGHNLGDVVSLILAWGASWLATKPSTDRFSYGYKRTSILAALINALLLIFTSGAIVYESIRKLISPSPVDEIIVIIVAAIGILINGGTAMLFIKGREHDLNIKGAFLHLASDALISLGVVGAGIAILLTGWYWLDPLAGLLIVAAILYGTWDLLCDSMNLLLDAVPVHVDRQKVKNYLMTVPGVKAVHDLHIWGLSTKEVALTAHLVMPEQRLEDEDYHRINDDLLHQFRINHVTLQTEVGDDISCQQAHSCE